MTHVTGELIATAAAEVAAAEQRLAAARARLYAAIRDARSQGATITRIMQVAGVSRATVYKALGEACATPR